MFNFSLSGRNDEIVVHLHIGLHSALIFNDLLESWEELLFVQAGSAITDNYGMWLLHHQTLSFYEQKSSQHIRLDILNRFVKGISLKIVWRCHTEERVFYPTINPDSKLGGFISVLINPTSKRRFFDPTFMCDCLLFESSQNVCVFWGCGIWGEPPINEAFTASGSYVAKAQKLYSRAQKNFFRDSETCTELHFLRRIQIRLGPKTITESVWRFFSPSWVPDDKNCQYPILAMILRYDTAF